MGITGYEEEYYANIRAIRKALEQVNLKMDSISQSLRRIADSSEDGKQ